MWFTYLILLDRYNFNWRSYLCVRVGLKIARRVCVYLCCWAPFFLFPIGNLCCMYIRLSSSSSSSSEYNCFASCQQRALMDLMKGRGREKGGEQMWGSLKYCEKMEDETKRI